MRPSVESCVYRKPKPKRSGHEVRQVALNRLYPDVLMMQPQPKSEWRYLRPIAEPIDERAHPSVKAGPYAIERLTLMSALLPKADMKPGHEAPMAAMAITSKRDESSARLFKFDARRSSRSGRPEC